MKGNRGVQFSDRQLAGNVRNMGLDLLHKILSPSYKNKQAQYELLLRIAPSLIPRQTEVTGEGGAPVVIQLSSEAAAKYGIKTAQ